MTARFEPCRTRAAAGQVRPPVAVAPLFVGPGNCTHLLGQRWRWTRDTARRLGVEVLRVGGKPLIRAQELAAALEAEAARQAPPEPVSDEDERARMRATLGLVRS